MCRILGYLGVQRLKFSSFRDTWRAMGRLSGTTMEPLGRYMISLPHTSLQN